METSTKIIAIYNVWDACELLPYSIASVCPYVDHTVFIFQEQSNFGEIKHETENEVYGAIKKSNARFSYDVLKFFPDLFVSATKNETTKRQSGLDFAKRLGFTHFAMFDCDEVWHNFHAAKQQYFASGAEGSVAEMYTYFGKPTLRLENVDNYYVPFIHTLRADTKAGNQQYPFYVDPTRRVNCTDVSLIQERMHHFSWVRKDIEMKVRNSSAKENIKRSQLLVDYVLAEPGMYLKDYDQKLIEVENKFNIEI